jgi:hypothetical protein
VLESWDRKYKCLLGQYEEEILYRDEAYFTHQQERKLGAVQPIPFLR